MLSIVAMDAKRSILPALVVILFTVLSIVRAAVYETEVDLYADVVAKSPNKARPRNNLGNALKEEHRIPEAMVQLERAIALKPDYPDALNNLGTVYISLGRRQEGLAMLQRALELDPGHLQAHFNLAMQYYEMGMFAEAVREYRLLIDLSPRSKEAAFASKMLALIGRARGGS